MARSKARVTGSSSGREVIRPDRKSLHILRGGPGNGLSTQGHFESKKGPITRWKGGTAEDNRTVSGQMVILFCTNCRICQMILKLAD